MNHIPNLSRCFLVTLLLSLVAGCGAEFQGAADEGGEAGAGIAPAAGTAGMAGSAPLAGAGGSGSTETGGAGGSAPMAGTGGATAGSAGSAGSAGAPVEPSCSPDEAVLELAGMTFTLDEYEWSDGSHCASCPPGGCITCTVDSYSVDTHETTASLAAVLRCDSAILAGTCDGERTLCVEQDSNTERTHNSTFSVAMDFEPKGNGYELAIAGTASSKEGSFICGDYGYSFNSKVVSLFEEMVDHSFLRCN